MSDNESTDLEVTCSVCGRYLAIVRNLQPGRFPSTLRLAPCEGCKVDKYVLEQIAKPVEERKPYETS